MLLASPADPGEIKARLWAFYRDCADVDMEEITRLATTVEQCGRRS